jgi:Amt family ammonium transporter
MDTNAVLDLMWVLICGILVFSCKVLPCRNWIYQIKRTQEYNNEKFNGFCIGSVAFWAIGYS